MANKSVKSGKSSRGEGVALPNSRFKSKDKSTTSTNSTVADSSPYSGSQIQEDLSAQVDLLISTSKQKIRALEKDFTVDLDKHKNDTDLKFNEIKDKIENSQVRIFEMLGIFVSIFTFVSISFQIFNRISSIWSAAIFVFLLFLLLASFVLITDLLLIRPPTSIGDVFETDFRKSLLLGFLIIGILLVIMLWYGKFQLNEIQGSVEFDNAFEAELHEQINSVNRPIYRQIGETDSRIDSLKECLRTHETYWPCVQE